MNLLPYGLTGWLVEVDSTASAISLYNYLYALPRVGPMARVADLVPGARTVLLDADPPFVTQPELAELLAGWQPGSTSSPSDSATSPSVEIPVHYDGPDLADTARMLGTTEDAVVAAHTGSDLRVAFCGFAPGFAYITGLPPMLHLPRLAQPRTAVPAGSVAVAGGFTGVYPRRSPGGWRLLGRTDVELWNTDRDPPALLPPGTRVRFTAA